MIPAGISTRKGVGRPLRRCVGTTNLMPRRRVSRLAPVEAGEGFHEGQKVWVITSDGGQRPAIYVGEGDNASFFGGPPLAYIVFADDRSGAEVQLDMIVPRDE
jgi:hypothetical protein